MKKRLLILICGLMILTAVLAGCVTSSLSGTGMVKNLVSGHWTISAKSINGHISQKVNFSSDDLSALYVKNTNSEGTMSLVLTQGDMEKTFDLTGTFDGNIDTSAFTPGKLSIRLNLDKAKGVDVEVKWK